MFRNNTNTNLSAWIENIKNSCETTEDIGSCEGHVEFIAVGNKIEVLYDHSSFDYREERRKNAMFGFISEILVNNFDLGQVREFVHTGRSITSETWVKKQNSTMFAEASHRTSLPRFKEKKKAGFMSNVRRFARNPFRFMVRSPLMFILFMATIIAFVLLLYMCVSAYMEHVNESTVTVSEPFRRRKGRSWD